MEYKEIRVIAEEVDSDKEFRKSVTKELGITEEFVKNYIVNYLKGLFEDGELKRYKIDHSGSLKEDGYIKPTIKLNELLDEYDGSYTLTSDWQFCYSTHGHYLSVIVKDDLSEMEFKAYNTLMKQRYSHLSEKEIKTIYDFLDKFHNDNIEVKFFKIFEKSNLGNQKVIDILDKEIENTI